ncbi:MAG: 50S ribosomal protein L44e [DPANN group archaeon]|nr:50S ribosomal protein L44e [DPANN group archaeon]
MKLPEEIKRFCPSCNGHNVHKIKRVKTAGRAKASLKRRDRHIREKLHKGYGGSPKPLPANSNRYGAKTSQKIMIKFTCTKCNKAHQSTDPKRSKKFEITK